MLIVCVVLLLFPTQLVAKPSLEIAPSEAGEKTSTTETASNSETEELALSPSPSPSPAMVFEFDEGKISEEALFAYFPKYLHNALKAYAEHDCDSVLSLLSKKKKPEEREYPDKYHLLRGICQVKTGDYDRAIESLQRSLEFRE